MIYTRGCKRFYKNRDYVALSNLLRAIFLTFNRDNKVKKPFTSPNPTLDPFINLFN